jgi:hypothetical protein
MQVAAWRIKVSGRQASTRSYQSRSSSSKTGNPTTATARRNEGWRTARHRGFHGLRVKPMIERGLFRVTGSERLTLFTLDSSPLAANGTHQSAKQETELAADQQRQAASYEASVEPEMVDINVVCEFDCHHWKEHQKPPH